MAFFVGILRVCLALFEGCQEAEGGHRRKPMALFEGLVVIQWVSTKGAKSTFVARFGG